MPSPFPGMDPWLEDPLVWPNLHHLLISATNSLLKPQLRPRGYLVTIGERLLVSEPGRSIYPDVVVVKQGKPADSASGGVAVLADAPVRVKRPTAEPRQAFLEILDAGNSRLVTAIEFLSPVNKTPGPNRDLYLKKQQEVLSSPANLVEIDLLRSGRHTLAVPAHLLDSAWDWDYLVCISRASEPSEHDVYPIPLPSRLPRIRIPLKPGDEDGVLDLQLALDQAYDAGPFDDRANYAANPFGKLAKQKLDWCQTILAGRRPS